MEFRRHIFRPAFRNTGRFRYYDLERGAAILDSNENIDTYIVAYGPGHYHKLMAAFEAVDIEELCRFPIEIIDWGCGIALGAWSLLKSMELEGENFTAVHRITLIEPSWLCLVRGITYLGGLAADNGVALPTLNVVNKFVRDLQPHDLVSQPATAKVHIFSNVLDLDTVNIAAIHRLIVRSFPGPNIIVATSPHSMERLDHFVDLFRNGHDPQVSSSTTRPVPCWRYRTVRRDIVEDDTVSRAEKVFLVRIA